MEAAFLARALGKTLGAVFLDILGGPDFAFGVVSRDDERLVFLVGKNSLGGRCLLRLQVRGAARLLRPAKLLLHAAGSLGLAFAGLLLAQLELGRRLRRQRRLLPFRQRVPLRFPAHLFSGAVVLGVSRRVAVAVADVEAGRLSLAVPFDHDAVGLAVENGMLTVQLHANCL